MAISIEEKVEEYYKAQLDRLGIRHYGKTEFINHSIEDALKNADSKSGNSGRNYPDIKLLLQNKTRRDIPVMVEAKGSAGKLEKLDKNGDIELVSGGKNPYSAVMNYAVNGALHYGNAILAEGTYREVIIVGINGTTIGTDGIVSDPEIKAYYLSNKNNGVPKLIEKFSFQMMSESNLDGFYALLNGLNLTQQEIEKVKRGKEELLEKSIKDIHQRIYDDQEIKNLLSTNDKLFFFCGLIMAGLTTEGVKPLEPSDLHSNDDTEDNDGTTIINRTKAFLKKKRCNNEKIDMVVNYLKPVFEKRNLWRPVNGESIIKSVYKQVKAEILPLLESDVHLDFTGKILNSLNDWVSIEQGSNDVVLTPRFVTNMMARICRTDMNSFVWDTCTGSSGFLVSAMDLMIADAKSKIQDKDTLDAKIEDIKSKQLLGIEILGNIYILAVLNMILMGDGSSQVICADSHIEIDKHNDFPANVFLLNPPYSAAGKGLIFVDEALSRMVSGYGAVLIQENAGSGQGGVYTKRILEKNTLVASIHMPADLFCGKASVQTCILLFKCGEKHDEKRSVTFVDFSEDGYKRQNRKKSSQEVNLRDDGTALARYNEIVDICLGNIPETSYYTEENGKLIRDKITLSGEDWTFMQHRAKTMDYTVNENDVKKVVADYLAWKVSNILKGQG